MKFPNKLLTGLSILFFVLPLDAQPVITIQPVSQMVIWGGTATFSVAATGPGPFSYQWQWNGTNLPNNIITTVAGNGSTNYSGDGGLAVNASLNYPQGVAFDAAGNLYIADNNNDRVRKVDTNGIITTVAGNGFGANTNGGSYSGDGGAATNAGLFRPNNLAFDIAGNMYIADIFNNRVRKVDTNGVITTVAGNGTRNDNGNGGQATNAGMYFPASVALDAQGNIYIADLPFSNIRKVDTNGIINTVAGQIMLGGAASFSGDGGMATNAGMISPQGVASDHVGNYYIADSGRGSGRIRKVDTNGIITTVAGGGGKVSSDGGAATNARIGQAWGAVLDRGGNLYFADESFDMVRKVDTNGIITTVAGKLLSGGYSGDGGVATNALLNGPASVALDVAGNVFIAEWYNNRIRKVQFVDAPMITLNNVTLTNAGNYDVVITGSSGSVTSSVVSLKVQLPSITPVMMFSNNLCTFTWGAVSNLTYQLQSTTNLIAPVWLDVGSPITATNIFASTTDILNPVIQHFYRVRLWP